MAVHSMPGELKKTQGGELYYDLLARLLEQRGMCWTFHVVNSNVCSYVIIMDVWERKGEATYVRYHFTKELRLTEKKAATLG